MEITAGVKLTRGIILVPILRAGLGFLDGFLDLIPQASVAHIGLARNENTLVAESYYLKHPPVLGEQEVIILDPMLATGGSAIEAVRRLREAGASHVRFACLVAAPEGVSALETAFPELGDLRRLRRPLPEFLRLHPARPGRCRRPSVRHLRLSLISTGWQWAFSPFSFTRPMKLWPIFPIILLALAVRHGRAGRDVAASRQG